MSYDVRKILETSEILPFEAAGLGSVGPPLSAAKISLASPSSLDKKDSTLSSNEPTSPKGSRSSC
jgi:hypothetical protein